MRSIQLRIGSRLALGFGALVALLAVVMALGLYNMSSNNRRTENIINNQWKTAGLAHKLVVGANTNQQRTVEMLFAVDTEGQQKAKDAILEARKINSETQAALQERVSTAEGKALMEKIAAVRGKNNSSFDKIKQLVEAGKNDEAVIVMREERLPAVAALTSALQALADYQSRLVDDAGQESEDAYLLSRNLTGVLGIIAIMLGSALAYYTGRHITRATGQLQNTVQRVADGDYTARSHIKTGDELEVLGNALDGLLNERVGSLAQKEKENEALNVSIMDLLRSVSKLSRGDLTVKAPVREDITGALADAINAMSDATAKTLGGVNSVSHEVRFASQGGRDTVLSTAKGMNEIRGTIQETGKRIKRLGERSQEITGIVKLIDDIAERTSVLALNANMQAAMAGEAGRGFRVVADEVQRLAERSKEATDQISKLVSNIQTETNDTIATMDRAIGEVVKGGELAELAARQVTHLDDLGGQLIASVQSFTLPPEYAVVEGVAANRRAA
jgi:methyl-accepting chemotaxis protein